jgi:hypothetical protein
LEHALLYDVNLQNFILRKNGLKEKKEEKNVVHNLTQVDNFHDQNQN